MGGFQMYKLHMISLLDSQTLNLNMLETVFLNVN